MKLINKIKHEFLLVLPPTIFFFISFLLLATTRNLIEREYGIPLTGLGVAVMGALIVGKVVLVVDKLSLMNKFAGKPLLCGIAWKSGIYFLATFVVRYAEHVFPLLREGGDILEAHRHLLEKIVWPHFWIIQMWLAVLFFLYCLLRELVQIIGRDKLIYLFWSGMPVTAEAE
ncbi:hypothetical protein [Candidatus Methylomicrobium oryzae]|jgi:hypothetical protein|uniref:hypothetical protein n=1 Tax=Candidatus Methylomicrobium oryzae TaxID=2802053 RepID=UPI0019212572|nr:hypothetical protein [Methylomicrobium sp. RS1]MBL1265234.1 hypothetical protein [Methylomicrobium sp. RS1]